MPEEKKTCKQVNTQTKEQSGLKTEGGIELATKTERVGVNTNELSRVDAEENLKGIDAREAAQAKKRKRGSNFIAESVQTGARMERSHPLSRQFAQIPHGGAPNHNPMRKQHNSANNAQPNRIKRP